MKLAGILRPDHVAVGIVVTSKKRALEEIARLLATGADGVSQGEILASLAAREKLGSTGLGHGVALPHGRSARIEHSTAAFIKLKQAVDYEMHDERPVDLLFGLLVPQHAAGEHLQYLASIAEKFSDDGFCAKARAATDAASLHALVIA